MGDKIARADRYAQAVLQAMLEQWQRSLEQAGAAIGADEEVKGVLADPAADAAARRDVFAKMLPDNAPEEISNLLLLMAQEDDLDLIGDVSSILRESVSGQRAPMKAEVASAIELTETEQASIRSKLISDHGEGLLFTFRVDPNLLGGLRVRVGDHLIDMSVATRLATLRESLSSAVR